MYLLFPIKKRLHVLESKTASSKQLKWKKKFKWQLPAVLISGNRGIAELSGP